MIIIIGLCWSDVTSYLREDRVAGQADPEELVVPAGQPHPVAGAGAADQPSTPKQQTENHSGGFGKTKILIFYNQN